MIKKVLFIDEPAPRMEFELNKLGFTCDHFSSNLFPREEKNDYELLLPHAKDYAGFVIRSRFAIDRTLIDASPHLQFIARVGAGMENIDTTYAEAKGIRCINSPEGNADAVSEYVVGSILNMLRRFAQMDKEVHEGLWRREANRGYELHNKTVGILGYGTMGQYTARKLSSFGCRVICHDKYRHNYGDAHAEAVDLHILQQQTDILSIHINYLPENFHYINAAFLQGFAKDLLLVNTSRGKSLHTADLAQCLQSGKVRIATIDVLEYENIQLQIPSQQEWGKPLLDLAASGRVFFSPHVAGQTFESLEKHVDVLINKIKAITTIHH